MTDLVYTHLLKHISPFWGDKFNPFLMTICLFQVFVMTPIWNTNCSCLTRKSFITRFIGLLTSSILHRCKRVRSTTPTVRTCTVSPTDLWCYCWRLSGHLRGLRLQIGCALSFKTLSRCLLGSTVSSTCFKILYNASLFFWHGDLCWCTIPKVYFCVTVVKRKLHQCSSIIINALFSTS